ncbi:MAG: hypothetical protein K2O55_00820, partial [Alistipes sp.]|nr:hypothetical protein [Alistipes sp.]
MFQMKSERLKGECHSVERLRLDQKFLSPHRKAPVPSSMRGAQHLSRRSGRSVEAPSRHCEGRQARGNLNKTDHLCFNHNRPVVVLVQIATASAMPRDDGEK